MKVTFSRASYCAAAGVLFAANAAFAEQLSGFSITPSAGLRTLDRDLQLDDAYYGSLGLGYKFATRWGFELTYQLGEAIHEQQANEIDIEQLRFDALYHFDRDGQVQPFIMLGGGEERWDTGSNTYTNSVFNAGVGLQIWLNDWASLRTDLRVINDLDNEHTSYAAGLGLRLLLGGSKPKPEPVLHLPADTDGDAVFDDFDNCPDSPAGAEVDENGCSVLVDDDQDGITNAEDACPDTSFGAKVDERGCYILITETKEIRLQIEFAPDSVKVPGGSYTEIAAVAEFMREHPLTDVHIEGHTDDTGAAAYNLTLSQQRAQAVADVLVEQYGIAASRVAATGYGEADPLAANNSPANRARNRRVTAAITAQVERVSK